MKRFLFSELENWFNQAKRTPLVIRGARQVGKTWLIRHFAESTNKRLIELNFERNPEHVDLFATNEVRDILLNIGALIGQRLDPENTFLFLDEIQVAPELLAKLRWFSEELPGLPVIATGSLLEFALAEHTFSMPVGRIQYLFLEPMSFEEFIVAEGKETLLEYIQQFYFHNQIPSPIHQTLSDLTKEYFLVGGLPAVVENWQSVRDLNQMHRIQSNLLLTYRDDFNKYQKRIPSDKLDTILTSIPRMLGEKFTYSHVSDKFDNKMVKHGLQLLEKAKLCSRVQSCAANEVPLGAEIHEKFFKEIFIDVGLATSMLGVDYRQIQSAQNLLMIHRGALAEQWVGQTLRTLAPSYIEPALYYWHRNLANANAELDYIIQHSDFVVPIEVKAGSIGSLKSLHGFMHTKGLRLAVRVNSDFPSVTPVSVKNHAGELIEYTLISIPFYLLGQLHRLLSSL